MSYIVVGGTQNEQMVSKVQRFLYEGQKVLGEPVKTSYGTQYVIVDTGTNDEYRSRYIRDRLTSGLYSAKLFTSLPEAEAFIAENK